MLAQKILLCNYDQTFLIDHVLLFIWISIYLILSPGKDHKICFVLF